MRTGNKRNTRMCIGIAVLMLAMACMAGWAIFYMTFSNTAGNMVVAIHNPTSGSLLDCIDIHIEVPRVIMKNVQQSAGGEFGNYPRPCGCRAANPAECILPQIPTTGS